MTWSSHARRPHEIPHPPCALAHPSPSVTGSRNPRRPLLSLYRPPVLGKSVYPARGRAQRQNPVQPASVRHLDVSHIRRTAGCDRRRIRRNHLDTGTLQPSRRRPPRTALHRDRVSREGALSLHGKDQGHEGQQGKKERDRMTDRQAEYIELTIIAAVILATAIWIVSSSAR